MENNLNILNILIIMPGGTLQLHSYGPKNTYFTGNPQLTFFKTIYRRHTNFAIEPIQILSNKSPQLGNTISYNIEKTGQLLSDIYLQIDLKLKVDDTTKIYYNNICNLGFNLINQFNIEIGGKIIDKQYGTWLQIWNELTDRNIGGTNGRYNQGITDFYGNLHTNSQILKGLGVQVLNITNLDGNNYIDSGGGNSFFRTSEDNNFIYGYVYIQLPFWFTKNPGLALPLIAIKDTIKIFIEFNSFGSSKSITNYSDTSMMGNLSSGFIHNNLGICYRGIEVISISCGLGALTGILTNGINNIYMWGSNTHGQLGNNSSTDSLTPVQPTTISTAGVLPDNYIATKIDIGVRHTSILIEGVNNVYMWGGNVIGQLGNNSTTSSFVAVQPVTTSTAGSLPDNYVATDISCGTAHTGILTNETTNNVYMWGANSNGQLGNNSTTTSLVAVQPVTTSTAGVLPNDYTATDISCGGAHTGIITTETSLNVYMWGINDDGELGNNSTTNSSVAVKPVTISTAGVLPNDYTATNISCGLSYTGITTSETSLNVYMWGSNTNGQLGNNSTTNRQVPVKPLTISKAGVLPNDYVATVISCGSYHTGILTNETTNNVYMWGANSNGHLGNNSTTYSTVAVNPNFSGDLSTGYTGTIIACGNGHTGLIISSIMNNIFMCGYNLQGQLGNETTTNSSLFNIPTILQNTELTLIEDQSTYKLWGEYIFVDEMEKRLIQHKDHEYLIEQIQYVNYTLDINSSNGSLVNVTENIPFYYCIKELIWAFQRKEPLFSTELLSLANHDGTCKIIFNGNERFSQQNVLYFTRYQPNKYHTGRGGINSPDSIFVYSFSLYPEKYEPSGVCNFSMLDTIEIQLNDVKLALDSSADINDGVDMVMYAVNYNIMEIRDGQVDVLYKPTL